MGAFTFVNPLFDPFDELINSKLLSPRQIERLSPEQLGIVRANVRSEILTSREIHEMLSSRVRRVVSELMGTKPQTGAKRTRPGGGAARAAKPKQSRKKKG